MSYDFYKILHMVGIAALSLGLGGMFANSGNRKPFAILQGIGLLLMLVSGFGLGFTWAWPISQLLRRCSGWSWAAFLSSPVKRICRQLFRCWSR